METDQLNLWHDDFMHNASKSVAAILNSVEEWNKSAMARKCKIPQPTISLIANGKVVPSLDVLTIVAQAYGFDVWQLLVEDFDPLRPPVLRYMSKAEESLYLKFKELRASMAELGDS